MFCKSEFVIVPITCLIRSYRPQKYYIFSSIFNNSKRLSANDSKLYKQMLNIIFCSQKFKAWKCNFYYFRNFYNTSFLEKHQLSLCFVLEEIGEQTHVTLYTFDVSQKLWDCRDSKLWQKMTNFYKKKQTKKTELITFKKSFQAISTILNLL